MKNQIPVIIDHDPLLKYETCAWSDSIRLPITLILTIWVTLKRKFLGTNLNINTFWFDGVSLICREIKENACKWRALDIVYNYNFKQEWNFRTAVTNFWLKLKNARAVRNRLKLIKKKLREELEKFSYRKVDNIKLLSIACGSAQGVIEVMAEFKQKGISIKAIFLDRDPTAIEYSKKLAQRKGVSDLINFVNKSASILEEGVNNFSPDIVEMVGFLDYRPKDRAIKLIQTINRILAPGGVALISNIVPNIEKFFLFRIVNWPMIYRSPKDFSEVLIKSGFYPQNCQIIYEPLKIQGIAICRK